MKKKLHSWITTLEHINNNDLNKAEIILIYKPLMCAPGLTHSFLRMGVGEKVAVTMTSASLTHSSAFLHDITDLPSLSNSLANFCALSCLWFQIRIWTLIKIYNCYAGSIKQSNK